MEKYLPKWLTETRETSSHSSWFGANVAECAPAPPVGGGMTPISMLQQKEGSGVQSPPPMLTSDGKPIDATSVQANPQPPAGTVPGEALPPQDPLQPKVEYTSDGRKNPGQFDKADSDALRVLKPDIFDGCRFEHNKMLGPNFTVNHSLWLGSAMLQTGNNYSFGSTVVLNEGKTMLLGRIDPEGRLDAQWHQEIVQPQKVISRVQSSISSSSEQSMTQGSLEINGIDYAATLKLTKGPMFGLSYFQSVTPKIAMGAESFYHHGQGVSHIFARGKYDNGKDIATATLTTMGSVSANYARKVNDRVTLAAEFEVALDSKQSQMNFGYEFMLRQSKISGVISTEGIIQTQIQEALMPGFAVIFNGILDHGRDTHRFGYGVQIG
mmetsp:Transcript_9474/g.10909  ORF Transcript_9474/g.10909 Transcript_9474/m.10909 type:complete len:381 (-) Transcript_9474:151-1293(-)